MRKLNTLLGMALLGLLILAGCGGGSGMNVNQNNAAQVSLSLRDTPPAGVTVLSFEITVTGASLQPTNMMLGPVSLVTAPIKVEVKKLETESAFLNTMNVPAGTYSSISVTFASPEITILNQSGQNLTVGSKTCLNGNICELEPALNQVSASVSTAPFPLTLAANSPLGLVLDFDLNNSIQSNLTVTPAISFTEVPATQQTGELEEIEDVIGMVTATGSQQFTLQDNVSGLSIIVNTNSETEFDFEGQTCAGFSCIQMGQTLKVDLKLRADGTFLAKDVEMEGDVDEREAEGTVVGVTPNTNQFQMVLLDDSPGLQNVNLGNLVTVTILAGADFRIDADGLSVPNNLLFASISDLVVGQEIQVRAKNVSLNNAAISISADRLRLRMSQFTATVSAVTPILTVNGLSDLFVTAGITSIQIQTSSQTEFEGVNGTASLMPGDLVSLRGLLFQTSGAPVLVAKKVRDRQRPPM